MEPITTCPDCGGNQSGPLRWHWMSCQIRFGRPLPPENVIKAELQSKIAYVCAAIDRQHGSPPGTALRGTYSIFWPPMPSTSIETLCYLLGDARSFLVTGKLPLPETACSHAPKASRRSTAAHGARSDSTKPRRQRRIPDPA